MFKDRTSVMCASLPLDCSSCEDMLMMYAPGSDGAMNKELIGLENNHA